MNEKYPEETLVNLPVSKELESLIRAAEGDGQTVIHCLYVSKKKYINGGWVNIWPSTFLFDANSAERIEMIQAFQIPLSPNKYFFKSAGQLKRFSLLFPRLPQNWKHFHFREFTSTGSGFTVRDIVRNNSGIYHIELK